MLDPDQRRIILDGVVRSFSRKILNQTGNEKNGKEMYNVLEELAMEYEQKKLDPIEIYEKALEEVPNDRHLLKTIVGLLRAKDARDKKAVSYYKKLSEIEPGNFHILSLLLECYEHEHETYLLKVTYELIVERYNKFQEAMQWEGAVKGQDWENVETLYQEAIHNLAEIYSNMNREDEDALKIYHMVVHDDEPNLSVLHILANTYIKNRRTDPEAVDIYELFLAYEPYNREVRLLLASGYLAQQRRDEALPVLRSLYDENHDDTEALELLVSRYREKDELNELTVPYYIAWYEKHPDDSQMMELLAHYHADQHDLSSQAIELYKKFLSQKSLKEKEKVKFYRLMGRYHSNNKKWTDVTEIYEKLRKLEPSSKDTVIPLATAYAEFDRNDAQALKLYIRSLEQGSRNEKIHTILCRYYFEKKNRSPKAIKTYKDSLAIHPKNRWARYGLCDHYIYVCEYENGLNEALRLLRFIPRNSKAIMFAAECIAHLDNDKYIKKLDDLDEIDRVNVLNEAYERNSKSGPLLLALSEVLKKEDQLDRRSVKILENTVIHKPDDVQILQRLSRHHQEKNPDRAFRYDLEIYKICRRKCKKFSPRGHEKPLEMCREACFRLADYLMKSGKKHVEDRSVFSCVWKCGGKNPEAVRRLTDYFLNENALTQEAADVYSAFLEIEPENEKVQHMLLRAELKNGDPDPALKYCEAKLKKNLTDEAVQEFLVECLTESAADNERITFFLEKIRKKDPENVNICLALALLYSRQRNYQMAVLPVYLIAVQARPADLDLLSALARCYEETGNYKQAAGVYERIYHLIPDDTTITASLARNYCKVNARSERAVEIIRQASQENPDDQNFYFYLADTYFSKGEIDRGVEILENLLNNKPDSLDDVVAHIEHLKTHPEWTRQLHLKLGFMYIHGGYYDKAVMEFSRLSDNVQKYCGDLIEGYDAILRNEPGHMHALMERGVLLKIIGRYEQALEDLEKAHQIEPDNQNVLYELAECYEKVLSSEKDADAEKLKRLGRLYQQLEEYDKSIKAYQDVLKKDKNSREALLAIGKSFHMKKELELALQYFSRLDITEEVKEMIYQIGDEYYHRGSISKSINALNYILAVDITYRDVSIKLGELRDELRKRNTGSGKNRNNVFSQLGNRARQRFEFIEEVGRGTMGLVFKAYDKELDEVVALKVLSEKFSEDEAAQARFRLEVKSARRLSHPNIVRIYDIGVEDGRKYISMEYVDGGDLKKLLRAQKRLSTVQAVDFGMQIASALSAAHQFGIIHRDIKPANILLTADKNCKITDFGIATFQEDVQEVSSDIIIGTPLYMSPEQNEGRPLTPASDIYAFGILLYEMLCGSPPFNQGNIAYHHIFSEPPPMKDVDGKIESIVMKCLSKKPGSRYQSMVEVESALKQSLE